MVPGTILLPIGLLITGWTVENHTHWIAPDIVRTLYLIVLLLTDSQIHVQGITLVGAGIVLNFQSVQVYVVDAFTLYAASGKYSRGRISMLLIFLFLSPSCGDLYSLTLWYDICPPSHFFN